MKEEEEEKRRIELEEKANAAENGQGSTTDAKPNANQTTKKQNKNEISGNAA